MKTIHMVCSRQFVLNILRPSVKLLGNGGAGIFSDMPNGYRYHIQVLGSCI